MKSRFLPLAAAVFILLGAIESSNGQTNPVSFGSASDQVSRSGTGASYAPIFSADGRRIAFVSRARNLTAGQVEGRYLDVYARDIAGRETTLVSVDAATFAGGNGHSTLPVLSSNGMVVAFESEASNLSGNDTNRVSDVYVRNLSNNLTEIVSVDATSGASGNRRSWNPRISADGRFVVFESLASNLVTNDFNGTNDVFIRDLATGVTTLVSVNAEGTSSADGPSETPSISSDGRTVAFVSRGANLVAGATNRLGEIYVRDVVGGNTRWAVASHLPSTRDPSTLAYSAAQPVLSADGRYVAFKTQAGQIVRFDMQRATNSIVTSFPESQPAAMFRFEDNPRLGGRCGALPTPDIAITPDGRYLTFVSGPNVIPANTVFRTDFENFVTNIVYEPAAGGSNEAYHTNQVPRVEIVSTAVGTNLPAAGRSVYAGLSADGQRVIFLSDSTNLISQPTAGDIQLYWRDLTNGDVRILSTNRSGAAGAELDGVVPVMDQLGLRVAYYSIDALVPGDLNAESDVYLHDTATGEAILISERKMDRPSLVLGGDSYVRPNCLSADGKWLAFQSLDLQSPDNEPLHNHVAWLRDIDSGTNQVIHPPGYWYTRDAVLSGDGRYVGYLRSVPIGTRFTLPSIVRVDRVTGSALEFSTTIPGVTARLDGLVPNFAMSPDGLKITHGVVNITVYDSLLGTNILVTTRLGSGSAAAGTFWNPVFSSDGRWLAFVSTSTELTVDRLPGLHIRNLNGPELNWLSDSLGQTGITNGFAFSGDSKWIAYVREDNLILRNLADLDTEVNVATSASQPALSHDGRFVAFESWAGDPKRQVVRLDRQTGETALVSRNRFGAEGGNGPSTTPVITPDGRFVIFASRASDLVENDSNGQSDIFVRDTLLGTTVLASVNRTGTASGDGPSSRPILGADGRTVMFHSFAGDLVEGDYNDRRDVFLLRLGGVDGDGDQLDDDWELAYFNNRDRDGSGDFDQDGVSDRDEFLAGTSPTSDTSILRVLTLTSAGGPGVNVIWSAVPGRSYRVQFKDSLDDESWRQLGGLVTATAGTASALDSDVAGNHRFYRVVLSP